MSESSRRDSTFERDPRRLQELRCRPAADAIYRRLFGDIRIWRFDAEDDYLLDKRFACDVQLSFPNGQILLGQEKFLSVQYASFGTLTIEHEQNQWTHEPGDWFRLGVQFYFCGYEHPSSGFEPWCIVNYPALVLATQNGRIQWRDNANQNGRAKASFRYCSISELPRDCIIAGVY